jgi:asparagine synthase (glutamine-hydrolysing)
MSMLESLEARVPYLYHPLAEFIWSLPARLKLDRGVRKVLLRSLGERVLPSAVTARPKQGFAIPMDVWLWEPGRFRDAVYDTLRDRRCRWRGWFDQARVEAMLDDHDRLRSLHGHRLWTLFVLERWLRRWYDDDALEGSTVRA